MARFPRGLTVYLAPRGPNDREAVDFERFSVTPGARRIRCQKRKDTGRKSFQEIGRRRCLIEPHGDRIGKAHRIVFLPDAARITVTTRIVGSEIRIHHPKELMESDHSVQAAAQNASVRALKTQAEKLLPQRIEKLAAHHGFRYRSIRIKRLKSRWGSCSSDGEIVLNAFLMQLHWHLIDYVLLHELMHTRIMAHGPTFWNELESYVPNLKAVRNEIKNHRPILLAQKQPLRA